MLGTDRRTCLSNLATVNTEEPPCSLYESTRKAVAAAIAAKTALVDFHPVVVEILSCNIFAALAAFSRGFAQALGVEGVPVTPNKSPRSNCLATPSTCPTGRVVAATTVLNPGANDVQSAFEALGFPLTGTVLSLELSPIALFRLLISPTDLCVALGGIRVDSRSRGFARACGGWVYLFVPPVAFFAPDLFASAHHKALLCSFGYRKRAFDARETAMVPGVAAGRENLADDGLATCLAYDARRGSLSGYPGTRSPPTPCALLEPELLHGLL